MSITIELLENEIKRLREENQRLSEECASLREENTVSAECDKDYSFGLLHAHTRAGSYPCIYITCDLPNGDETFVALAEYNKESGKIQVSTYDEISDGPRTVYEMKTDLKEAAAECRRNVTECEAALNEAYREEHTDEVITAREEVELRKEIKNAKTFYTKFFELTGEEV